MDIEQRHVGHVGSKTGKRWLVVYLLCCLVLTKCVSPSSPLPSLPHEPFYIITTTLLQCWGRAFAGGLGLGDTTDRGDVAGTMGDSLPTISLGTGKVAVASAPAVGETIAPTPSPTVPPTPAPTPPPTDAPVRVRVCVRERHVWCGVVRFFFFFRGF